MAGGRYHARWPVLCGRTLCSVAGAVFSQQVAGDAFALALRQLGAACEKDANPNQRRCHNRGIRPRGIVLLYSVFESSLASPEQGFPGLPRADRCGRALPAYRSSAKRGHVLRFFFLP